jgi:cellulose synthase/poly-beta-1,6-N-acetylglucosamine synthase-like glycosyltransferase
VNFTHFHQANADKMISVLHFIFNTIIVLIVIYTIRHYVFTFNRLVGKQRHPYIDITTAQWPSVSVFVPAHNEEDVIEDSLTALLHVDYPQDKLQIVIVNDRSTDKTTEIANALAERYAGRIVHFHRTSGKPGKSSALKEAAERHSTGDIILVFDADYLPGRGLIKQLASPFFDPEVGLVMGRVVPVNTGANLLTRLLDMERAGGYQVDQQARMNMGLLPQFGGTVGGIRQAALRDIGGWREDSLAEDTDLTYRGLLKGWKTVYQNRSECYEEVTENWPARIRQIMRWAKGHNQTLYRYFIPVMLSKNISFRERVDALLLLGVYAMCPIVLLGWIVGIILFYLGDTRVFGGSLALLCIISYAAIGNFAAFFQISAGAYLDGTRQRIYLLPFNCFNFLISMLSVSRAIFCIMFRPQYRDKWDKTPRFRSKNFKVLE